VVRARCSALVVASIATLAIGCSTAPPVANEPPVRQPVTTTSAPVDGCPDLTAPTATPRRVVIVDCVDLIRLDGREYLAGFTPTPTISRADLGDVIAESRCSLSAFTERIGRTRGRRETATDTGFLPPGTDIYAVRGWDPDCRVAAERDGRLYVYLAQGTGADHARPAECGGLSRSPLETPRAARLRHGRA
jgi:hypothetical protein